MRALRLGDESSTPTCTTTREPAFAFPSSRAADLLGQYLSCRAMRIMDGARIKY
jgi:hypothetical protein